jgi:hypothetical protein
MKVNCEYSELLDTHKLVPHPRNANKHPERQIDILAKLIDFQGWRLPIIVSKRSGFVVAGHGRLEAAKKLGHEKVPVSYQEFESEAQEFAFLISDNKSSSLAEHDDAFMIEGIKELELDTSGFDFELLALPDFSLEGDGQKLMGEQKKSHQDYFDDWLDKDAKRVCFVFEEHDFAVFQQKAEQLKAKHNLETDADLLLHLVGKD